MARKKIILTDEQSSEAIKLRCEGFGYRAIGNVLDLSKDIINRFIVLCRKEGLDLGHYDQHMKFNGSKKKIQRGVEK
jgi:hypothetical protein